MLLRAMPLTCVLSLMSACVLPLAPEFQDPPASQNYAPFFFEVDPPLGSIVTTSSFRVTVSDPNVGDDLWVRFLADYPPYSADNSRRVGDDHHITHSADGKPLFQDVAVVPDCFLHSLAKLARHQIMVVVADREFLPPQSSPTEPVDFARVSESGKKIVGSWTLDMECK